MDSTLDRRDSIKSLTPPKIIIEDGCLQNLLSSDETNSGDSSYVCEEDDSLFSGSRGDSLENKHPICVSRKQSLTRDSIGDGYRGWQEEAPRKNTSLLSPRRISNASSAECVNMKTMYMSSQTVNNEGSFNDILLANAPTGWLNVLYQFSQESSIHGLRQMTQPQPYIIRR